MSDPDIVAVRQQEEPRLPGSGDRRDRPVGGGDHDHRARRDFPTGLEPLRRSVSQIERYAAVSDSAPLTVEQQGRLIGDSGRRLRRLSRRSPGQSPNDRLECRGRPGGRIHVGAPARCRPHRTANDQPAGVGGPILWPTPAAALILPPPCPHPSPAASADFPDPVSPPFAAARGFSLGSAESSASWPAYRPRADRTSSRCAPGPILVTPPRRRPSPARERRPTSSSRASIFDGGYWDPVDQPAFAHRDPEFPGAHPHQAGLFPRPRREGRRRAAGGPLGHDDRLHERVREGRKHAAGQR